MFAIIGCTKTNTEAPFIGYRDRSARKRRHKASALSLVERALQPKGDDHLL